MEKTIEEDAEFGMGISFYLALSRSKSEKEKIDILRNPEEACRAFYDGPTVNIEDPL